MVLLEIGNGSIRDSLSIVPIKNVLDLTASKALDTTYTNNTGRTLFLYITVNVAVTTPGGHSWAAGVVNGQTIAFEGVSNDASATMEYVLVLPFAVPPGKTYSVTSVIFNGFVTLYRWVEAW